MKIVIIPLLFLVTGFFFQKLEFYSAQASRSINSSLEEEKDSLYLPTPEAVTMVSFGYQNILSNLMWFRTINYFGKNYRGSRSYKWLGQMCNTVTKLNPRAHHAYQFCASLLAWEGEKADESVALLNRAIEYFPDDWVFYYLRGFMAWYFLNDSTMGQADLKKASELPGVSPVIVRLASKKMASNAGPEDAIDFLTNVLRATKDANARRSLSEHLDELYYERDLRNLEKGVEEYLQQFKRLPASRDELIKHSPALAYLARAQFRDPYGGEYEINLSTGEVRSTSGKKRPTLSLSKGKIAENEKRKNDQ